MKITCDKCGHEEEIEQPAIVLALGRATQAVSLLSSRPINNDDMSALGRAFRKWCSDNVASGFMDGLLGR